ncbi:MAG TPA: hypothetical protein VHG51_01745 [Longimicrobiaceae bacterium]|nr:hypothetical protein [Longimicrobiaceae bacterium]
MGHARNTKVGRGLFGMVVLAVLAFGAREATATPASPTDTARVCSNSRCQYLCTKAGYSDGFCYGVDCICG